MLRTFTFLFILSSLNLTSNAQKTFQVHYGESGIDRGWSVVEASNGDFLVFGHTRSYGANGDYFLVNFDCDGVYQWAKRYDGGNDHDELEGSELIDKTPDGGYIMAGGTWSAGAGLHDCYLVKVDAMGTLQWSKTYGTGQDEHYQGIKTTSDGGYIGIGHTMQTTSNDMYVLKVDASGNSQWAKAIGGISRDEGFGIKQTTDGGYIAAGYTNSYGAGSSDFMLTKLTSAGVLSWTKTYGGGSDDEGRAVIQTSDGGYAITGRYQSSGAGSYDAWLVKTDSSGNLQWSKAYGGTGAEYGWDIQETSDGGYMLSGRTSSSGAGGNDMYLIKVNSTGVLQWGRTYGGSATEYGHGARQTSDGGYVMVGYSGSFNPGNDDIYLVKTDASGISGACNNASWTPTTTVTTGATTVTTQSPNEANAIITGNPTTTTNSPATTTTVLCSAGACSPPLVLQPMDDLPDTEDSQTILIYPTLVANQFNIETANIDMPLVYELSDIHGRIVYKGITETGEKSKIQRPVGMAPGLYFLKISDNSEGLIRTQKLIFR